VEDVLLLLVLVFDVCGKKEVRSSGTSMRFLHWLPVDDRSRMDMMEAQFCDKIEISVEEPDK
jgi:hypothetical protein